MKKGLLASYRDKFLYLKEKALTDEQFILYEYCIHLADFDENHKDIFGTFQKTSNEELGLGLGWLKDKVARNLTTLLEHGLLKLLENNQIEVVDYYRFLPKNAFCRIKSGEETSYLLKNIAKMRSQNAEMREENANLRNSAPDLATNNTPISDVVSSKVNPVTRKVVIKQKTRSEEEYQRIYQQGSFQDLTLADMRWIDENVSEQVKIESEDQEKDIVRIFFNGGRDNYKKHLITT